MLMEQFFLARSIAKSTMVPTRFLARLLGWGERFAIAGENLGLLNAFRILVLWRHSRGERSIKVSKLNRTIHFRGVSDIGVVSHFFRPGYRILPPHDRPLRIIDAGADIGDETIRFRHLHPSAEIIALEPAKDNFRLLKMNCRSDPSCNLLNKGLWGRDGYLSVHRGSGNESFWVSEADDPKREYDVEAVSLPTLLREHGWDAVDILKLDIEGAERNVFEAPDTDWIRRTQVIIVECPDRDAPGTGQRIFAKTAASRFDVHVHGENLVFIRRNSGFRLTTDTYLSEAPRHRKEATDTTGPCKNSAGNGTQANTECNIAGRLREVAFKPTRADVHISSQPQTREKLAG